MKTMLKFLAGGGIALMLTMQVPAYAHTDPSEPSASVLALVAQAQTES